MRTTRENLETAGLVAIIGLLVAGCALFWGVWGDVAANTEKIGDVREEIGDVRVDTITAITANTVATERGLAAVNESISRLIVNMTGEVFTNRQGIRDLEHRLTNVEGGAP